MGTETIRIAIIGAGPSAFYAAEALQKQTDRVIEVDMFERLPTPFGLVRGGVAPDHPKIKTVTRIYDRIASHPQFRFYGHVEYGHDLLHADLSAHYHAVIYAVGAQTDRQMEVPGEDLPGSYAATEFVGWYNAHPDYRDRTFDLSQERVAVIGNGNVAMDVVRILARTPEELLGTDIADYALEALKHSRVKEIYMLGRRGPLQASFTNAELKELEELEQADVCLAPEEIELDPLSKADLEASGDRNAAKNLETLTHFFQTSECAKPRKIIIRFLVSPVEVIGTDHVEALKIVKNELYRRDDGTLRPRATDQFETLPVGLIFRSIGYQGVPIPDVPFDARSATIPNKQGRIIGAEGQLLTGEYVVGWIKRGPTGIIGTNKPDSVETVERLLEDIDQGKIWNPAEPTRQSVEKLLHERQVCPVSFEDWLILDQLEKRRGQNVGRPRLKYCTIAEMLDALAEYKRLESTEKTSS